MEKTLFRDQMVTKMQTVVTRSAETTTISSPRQTTELPVSGKFPPIQVRLPRRAQGSPQSEWI